MDIDKTNTIDINTTFGIKWGQHSTISTPNNFHCMMIQPYLSPQCKDLSWIGQVVGRSKAQEVDNSKQQAPPPQCPFHAFFSCHAHIRPLHAHVFSRPLLCHIFLSLNQQEHFTYRFIIISNKRLLLGWSFCCTSLMRQYWN